MSSSLVAEEPVGGAQLVLRPRSTSGHIVKAYLLEKAVECRELVELRDKVRLMLRRVPPIHRPVSQAGERP